MSACGRLLPVGVILRLVPNSNYPYRETGCLLRSLLRPWPRLYHAEYRFRVLDRLLHPTLRTQLVGIAPFLK